MPRQCGLEQPIREPLGGSNGGRPFQPPPAGRPRIFILSNVRLYREGVAISLSRNESVDVIGSSTASDAPARIAETRPEVVLLDSSLINQPAALRDIRQTLPQSKIVAFAVSEIDRELIACAEAGISAYVAREGSADDLVTAVHRAIRGELFCPPRVAALLFGHIATLTAERPPPILSNVLTKRENEITSLLERGLSNKEIASVLHVGTATVKNHVHNILEKLQVRRRGEVAALMRHGSSLSQASSGGTP